MKYTTIIFDLDDTLTDDKENVKVGFKKMLDYMNDEYSDEKVERFIKIDKQTWIDRNEGRLVSPFEDNKEKKTEWVRASRFLKYYDNKISYETAVKLNNLYLDALKEKVVPREGVFEIIKYLYDKGYKLIIATNGPIVPLDVKLEKLNIKQFISTVFSAEEVGFSKPNKQFYDGLFEKAKLLKKEKILFVGDELSKDIKGGIENGLDTCWCNYKNDVNNEYDTTYEIHSILELKNIL